MRFLRNYYKCFLERGELRNSDQCCRSCSLQPFVCSFCFSESVMCLVGSAFIHFNNNTVLVKPIFNKILILWLSLHHKI